MPFGTRDDPADEGAMGGQPNEGAAGTTKRRQGKGQRLRIDILGPLWRGPTIPSFGADPVLQGDGPCC
eukprot:12411033-Karenia_brevis.AAC.1